jgi:large subunit ribosomal protein L4
LFDTKGERVGEATLAEPVFGRAPNPHVLYETAKMYQANRRRGTAKAKPRSEIKGSRAKIWPQKGTGRARHGDRKANIFRGGGIAHPPQVRDYRYSVPVKVRRLAACVALSDRAREEKILVLKGFELEKIRTADLAALMDKIGIEGKRALLVPGDFDETLEKSGRNIPGVNIVPSAIVNSEHVCMSEYVVFDETGLDLITKRLSR